MCKTSINIVCATDEKYVPYCGVMLTSLFENNADRRICVYILIDRPLATHSQKLIRQLGTQYGQQIKYCLVDRRLFEEYPIKGKDKEHLSIVTYYRIFAADILPDDVRNVLYLDCDIVVNRSIGCLFDMDWEGFAVGTVPDMCTEWQEYYDRLGYDRGIGYFNAGSLFMNLAYWRENQVREKCMTYLSKNYDRLQNNDQDVLNVVTRHIKKDLSVSFNYQIQLRMPYFFNTFSEKMKTDILNTDSPHIIHFAAELKPWMAKYYSYPYYDVWQKYKRLSPWRRMRDELPKKRAWATLIKRYLFWPFGLMQKKPVFV